MDNMNGIVPTMPINGGADSFMWIFGLLILMGLFNGNGFGANGGYANAIQADVNRGFDNQNLQAQTRDILTAVNNGAAQGVAATNQVYHDIVGNLGDKYSELARDVANVNTAVQMAIANQNECCCSTKMQIAENKYENALALAGMEQRITAKMDANEIQNLRDQVQQLQLAQATAGVLRYPNSWSYGAGPFPPLYGNCNCGTNNI